MMKYPITLTWFVFCISHLFAETIRTFYGELEVEEPVLLELIHSPAFERLQYIHQYGISYYTKTHPEEYMRFGHSLGVFAILRTKKASLEEQIAGLLHDVSHTVFSHVGDWLFTKECQEIDYQSTIHNSYLARSGIETILHRYGYTIEQVSSKREGFTMLEQPLPNLCADRIDYNIQGAYFQNFLTAEEAQELFLNVSFVSEKWVLTNKELAMKLALFSLFMTEDCWGNPLNFVTSRWLADAIIHGLKVGLLTNEELHFGIDQDIWEKLSLAEDPYIQNRMQMLLHPHQYCERTDPKEANAFLKFRCRGIDPWIKDGENTVRLSTLYPELEEALQKMKQQSMTGWPVKICLERSVKP